MNEMSDIYESTESLAHYGTKHHSGRYPWGSGDDPFQHEANWYNRVKEYKSLGMDEKDIIKMMNLTNDDGTPMSTTNFRLFYRTAKDDVKIDQIAKAKRLEGEGYSKAYIAKELGLPNESSVRSLLNETTAARMHEARATVNVLKEELKDKKMIDIGKGTATQMGVSEAKFGEAVKILMAEGYQRFGVGVEQVTNKGQQTTTDVLARPEIDQHYAYTHKDEIQPVGNVFSSNGGDTFHKGFQYPESLDSKRLQIVYVEDGGVAKDGLIELRRGVKDLDLGDGKNYSQVRIMVNGTHYLKGMAVYADDLPDGVDVRFNCNKHKDKGLEGALKKIKDDPENPFGSLIKSEGGQSYYLGDDGKEHLSLINKRSDQGDWNDWGDKLPAQFLAKQNISLIKKQLNLTMSDYQMEYDDIMSLTNPTVKRKLLTELSNKLDANSAYLKAAALPRQRWHVILPMTTLKEDEIYAPGYQDGEKVALVRYPHEGNYQIPILTVNNKNQEGNRMIGKTSIDAVGIRQKAAEQLSGADFDGDTVMLIPTHNGKVKISNREPFQDLLNFDDKVEYSSEGKEGVKLMSKKNLQKEMGVISNLIMDMTIKHATDEEMIRATKHSMTIIDSVKHELDYKQSERDNGIKELHAKYQGHMVEEGGVEKYKEGAGTLLTRAKSQSSITKRQGQPHIDPETGELIYKNTTQAKWDKKTGAPKVDSEGNPVLKTEKSFKMWDTKDAHTLSTGTEVEEVYADFANFQKNLANECRKASLVENAGKLVKNASAAKTYAEEVESLKAQVRLAELNKPKERMAQRIANVKVEQAIKAEGGSMEKEEEKKLRQKALSEARLYTGAKRNPITLTPRTWEAIQAGAVSDSFLMTVLNYTDMDSARELSMPKNRNTKLSSAKVSKIKSMASSDYTIEQIAKACACSPSTVSKYLSA